MHFDCTGGILWECDRIELLDDMFSSEHNLEEVPHTWYL